MALFQSLINETFPKVKNNENMRAKLDKFVAERNASEGRLRTMGLYNIRPVPFPKHVKDVADDLVYVMGTRMARDMPQEAAKKRIPTPIAHASYYVIGGSSSWTNLSQSVNVVRQIVHGSLEEAAASGAGILSQAVIGELFRLALFFHTEIGDFDGRGEEDKSYLKR